MPTLTGRLTFLLPHDASTRAVVRASAERKRRHRAAYNLIKILGTFVLIGLGVHTLARVRADTGTGSAGITDVSQIAPGLVGPLRAGYRVGLLTNLANPKAAGFAASFLPQFVLAHAPVLETMLIVAMLQVLISIFWYAIVAWGVNQARQAFSRPIVRRRLEQSSGIILIGFGVRMVV
jgi:threonine/homoserine/homoserine lactone efflux protein